MLPADETRKHTHSCRSAGGSATRGKYTQIYLYFLRYTNITREGRSRTLRDLGLAYVHHVDLVTGMYAAHMSAHVRRMPRPVRAVGTIEPRLLAALDPQVILQIMLHAKDAAAIAAGVRRDTRVVRVDGRRREDGRPARAQPAVVVPVPEAHRPERVTCKKKAQDVPVKCAWNP